MRRCPAAGHETYRVRTALTMCGLVLAPMMRDIEAGIIREVAGRIRSAIPSVAGDLRLATVVEPRF